MEEQTFRVHNSYIWLESVRLLFIMVFVFIITAFSSVIGVLADGDVEDVMIAGITAAGLGFWFLVIVGICFLVQWISYRHLYYSLGPDEFSLYKGVFNKQRIHVPYTRVQSVDKRAKLLQRIFGVCSIYIDTAGGENNKAIVVPYVAKAQADWLISQLYSRKMSATQAYAEPAQQGQTPVEAQQAQVPSAVQVAQQPSAQVIQQPTAQMQQPAVQQPAAQQTPSDQATGNILDIGSEAWEHFGGVFAGQAAPMFETVHYQYGLSNKELFLSGLSNNTAFAAIVVSVICVVLQVLGFIADSFPSEANSWLDNFSQLAFSTSVIPIFAIITVGMIGIFIFIWLMSAIGTCVSYGGFKARRYSDRIEVEHGLLQHTSASVSIERIQAVVIRQSFIRRIIGYCELSLDKVDAAVDTGNSSETKSLNSNGLVVHPFVKRSKVPEILSELLPEYSEAPTEEIPVARVAKRRAIIRRCIWQGGGFWLALITFITQMILNGVISTELSAANDASMIAGSILGSTSEIGGTISGTEAAEVMDIAFTYAQTRFTLWLINTAAIGLYIISVIICVINVIGAIFWARESGFAYNRRFMRMTNGGLTRETRTLPKQKIQFGFTRTNPLQELAKTSTINISTAAGMGTQGSLIDVEKAEALRWLEWLKPYQ